MPLFRSTTGVHEKTVQKAGEGVVMIGKKKRATKPRNGPVRVIPWYKDLDPMLLAWCRANKVHWKRVEILSPTEIIVRDEEN